MDVTIKNNLNQSYDFALYRKPAITNVQIKPHSNICPNIAMGVFKGFLFQLFRKLFSTRDRFF